MISHHVAAVLVWVSLANTVCLAESFSIRNVQTGEALGPFLLEDGTELVLGEASLTVVQVDARALRFYLKDGKTENVLGPLDLKAGGAVSLNGTKFAVVVPVTKWFFDIKVEKTFDSNKDTLQRASSRFAGVTAGGTLTAHYPKVKKTDTSLNVKISVRNQFNRETPELRICYALFKTDASVGGSGGSAVYSKGEETVAISATKTHTISVPMSVSKVQRKYETLGSASSYNSVDGDDYYGCAVAIYAQNNLLASYVTPNALQGKVKKSGWQSVGLDWP